MLAIVCPGQGSQTPGFLSPWLELDGAEQLLAELSEASETDLITHGTVSDEATIKDTAIAQPLIVAAGLLAAHALSLKPGQDDVVAGHSVGELTAASVAGVLSPTDAASLVGERARLMAQAAAAEETTMAALLGGAEADVLARIEEAGAQVANINAPGQIVAAGSRGAVDALLAEPGARVKAIELKVAGAFHTSYMASAVEPLAAAAAALTAQNPSSVLLTNRDGSAVSAGREYLDLIVGQVTRPVQWVACMETMGQHGVTGMLELSPAGTLIGLAKRGLKSAARATVNTPEDIDAALAFIAEHSGSAPADASA